MIPASRSASSAEVGLDSSLLEAIARAVHRAFRRAQSGHLPADDLSLRPWETLPETLRRSNLDQAAHILAKVHHIGCAVRPAGGCTGRRFRFRKGEVETLAGIEHERWMADRLADGWTPGPERDIMDRTTPYFVPYAELPEAEKEKDRQAVRNIPRLLAGAGLRICRP